ncbi:ROK family protein [Marisediminicola sp. LYQ85]|uniref:ROK family transcriptional regulator n=1 Tax=Marisediminicola sp. LYQ85 TaxID=3391062 RepID=UPI003983010F
MTIAAASTWAWPELHSAQREVLLDVLIHGSRSRADLARRTGMSRTSLSRITRDLVDLGLISEGEASAPSGRGRPAEMVHLRPDAARFIGIKLTGEALYAAISDLHANVLETVEVELESRAVGDVVALMASIIADLRSRFDRIAAVGVCLAGDVEEVDGRSLLIGSDFLGWDEVPLVGLVEAATGLPAAVSNDVQALTVAHHWFGAGLGCRSLVVIGLGAGIGSGIVVNDQLVYGSRGHSGKVGHTIVSEAGTRCSRGHESCASGFVTIPAILHNAGTGDFEATLALAGEGEARASRAITSAARALGEVVANLVNLVNPERVVITGEGLEIARAGADAFSNAVSARLDPATVSVPIVLEDFDFGDYAWAASIGAIRRVV